MTAEALVSMLEGQGVRLRAEDGGKLKLYAPPDRVPGAEVLSELRANKTAVLAVLRDRGAPPEIQFSSFPDPILRQTEKLENLAVAGCWHCGGTGQCDCSTCGVMRPSVTWTAGECVTCKANRGRMVQ